MPCCTSHKSGAEQQAEEIVHSFMEEVPVPGISVTVAKNGNILWSEGFGFADLEQQVPVDPSRTLFRIGSISKPITQYGMALLMQDGKMDVDAPVQQFMPGFPAKEKGTITTRLLAGHLAGIRHYRGDEFLSNTFYPEVQDGLEIFRDDSLLFVPGTSYSYSSYGWNLISAVMEQAAGVPFLEYMNEEVFDRLGMENTRAEYMDSIIFHRSRYYEMDRAGNVYNAPRVDNSYKWAGGGFLSTTEDLMIFAQEHLDPQYLQPAILEEITTSQSTADGKETGYGMGWSSGTDDNGAWFGHGGGSVGGTSQLRIYPEHNLAIAITANGSGVPYRNLHVRLAGLFLEDKDRQQSE